MKLPEHVDRLCNLIESAFDKQFARLGIGKSKKIDIEKLPEEIRPKRLHFEGMLESYHAFRKRSQECHRPHGQSQ